mmetsp:Transcript_19383/g.77430  ORF Transcript_19383/g.77430 Transcript_19383/m.77430 type:complete len:144 (+) Transcript_19383:944-1375(+)
MAFDGPDKYFPGDKSPWGIRYRFTLDENVMDTPEFLVHFPSFEKIAAEYDLELRLLMNFHQFYLEFIKVPEFLEIYERLKVVGQHGSSPPSHQDDRHVLERDVYLTSGFTSPYLQGSRTMSGTRFSCTPRLFSKKRVDHRIQA